MNRFLASHHATGQLDCAIRDDLVRVHVRLCAAAGLPDAQWEMIVELALDHFIASLNNELHFVLREFAEIVVHQRAALLQNAKRANHLAWHYVVTDIEVQKATLRLRAPIAIGGDFDLAHRVGFNARTWSLSRGFLWHELLRCGAAKYL